MPSQTTKFGNLLEAMPDALVGVDRAGLIRLVNHQTETLFGYECQDLIGASVETLIPKSVRQVHTAHRAGYNANPKTRPMGTDLRLSGRRADGTQFPVDIVLSPVNLGDRMLVMAAVRDISDRLRTESNRRRLDRLAAIVEHSDDAIISSTLDGIITSWNPAAERLYGYTSDEIIGKSTDLLSPKDQVSEIKAILGKIKDGEHVEHHHTTRVRKDGTLVRISLTASPPHRCRRHSHRRIENRPRPDQSLAVPRYERKGAWRVRCSTRGDQTDTSPEGSHHQQANELNRLAELERFQPLTVGRQIKMIELKKEIEYLGRSLASDRTDGGEPGDQH